MPSSYTFDDYQEQAQATAVYPQHDPSFVYPALGLAGEAGEVSEKLKKILRDKGGRVDDESLDDLEKELGDVLWYVAQLATELGLSLADIAVRNVAKLKSRKQRGVLGGSGDNR